MKFSPELRKLNDIILITLCLFVKLYFIEKRNKCRIASRFLILLIQFHFWLTGCSGFNSKISFFEFDGLRYIEIAISNVEKQHLIEKCWMFFFAIFYPSSDAKFHMHRLITATCTKLCQLDEINPVFLFRFCAACVDVFSSFHV